MRILHVTTSLDNGGAQAILFNLSKRCEDMDQHVVSLMGLGKYGEALQNSGVIVYTLNNKNGRFSMGSFRQLLVIIREIKPDVIQTWMYHADLAGGIVGRLAGAKKIVWGIHNTKMDASRTSKATLLIIRLLSVLSRVIPTKIIVCSRRALEEHVSIGYPESKMQFISNGYDLDRFRPAEDLAIISVLHERLEKREGEFLIGCVGRWSEQKDQLNLVRACSLIRDRTSSKFKCVMVGPDMDGQNDAVLSEIDQMGLANIVFLLGEFSDIPSVMRSLDVLVLPSAFGEAFPNVVAEAMSCGIPCIVTDVGDSRIMVGDSGWVVPPSDAPVLAQAIECAMKERGTKKWNLRKLLCRQLALEGYDIELMVKRYKDVWESVLDSK